MTASAIRSLTVLFIATGVAFTAVQLIPAATDTYAVVWGALQWPLRLTVDSGGHPLRVAVTPDVTDLLALPALLVAARIATLTIAKNQGVAKMQQVSRGFTLN